MCSEGYAGTRGIFSERTELDEVSRTGIEVVPCLQNCRVPVLRSYPTYQIVGYQHQVCIKPYTSVRERIELTEDSVSPVFFGTRPIERTLGDICSTSSSNILSM